MCAYYSLCVNFSQCQKKFRALPACLLVINLTLHFLQQGKKRIKIPLVGLTVCQNRRVIYDLLVAPERQSYSFLPKGTRIPVFDQNLDDSTWVNAFRVLCPNHDTSEIHAASPSPPTLGARRRTEPSCLFAHFGHLNGRGAAVLTGYVFDDDHLRVKADYCGALCQTKNVCIHWVGVDFVL